MNMGEKVFVFFSRLEKKLQSVQAFLEIMQSYNFERFQTFCQKILRTQVKI